MHLYPPRTHLTDLSGCPAALAQALPCSLPEYVIAIKSDQVGPSHDCGFADCPVRLSAALSLPHFTALPSSYTMMTPQQLGILRRTYCRLHCAHSLASSTPTVSAIPVAPAHHLAPLDHPPSTTHRTTTHHFCPYHHPTASAPLSLRVDQCPTVTCIGGGALLPLRRAPPLPALQRVPSAARSVRP